MKNKRLKLLILENNKDDIKAVKNIIINSKFLFTIKAADSKQYLNEYLDNFHPDLIISNYKLQGFTGLEALSILKKAGYIIPFIFFTDPVNEITAIKCLKAGASDYILKRQGSKLIPAILSSLKTKRYIESEIKKAGDISGRAIIENALIESEERFAAMADTTPVMIWIAAEDKKFFYFNKSWLQFTGSTLLNELGNNWMRNLYAGDMRPFLKKYISSFDSRVEFEIVFRLKRHDGKYRWILTKGSPRYLPDGSFAGYIGTAIDITDRKIAEDSLKESEEKYRTVVQNVREVIFKTDYTGIITFLNLYWSEITGHELEKSIGRYLFDFIHPDDKKRTINEFISIIYKRKDYCRFEFRIVTSMGEYRWFLINARIKINEMSNITGTYGTLNDIHDRRLTEEELIKAKEKAEESDRLKSHFLAQISHEIRSPLNIILGYNSLIKERLEGEPSLNLNSEFNIIEASSRRLLRTIDLVLNMSMIQTGSYDISKEEFDLKDLIENILPEFKPAAEAKKIKLSFKNNCQTNKIVADKYTFKQAFQNLLDNAIKFTDKGEVEVLIYENDKSIVIDIADTGVGISKDYLSKLFEPFSQEEQGYSRKFDGNGLGLALTKKYIELNQGEITVKSSKGKGTTFTITLGRHNKREVE
jgi:PAS domain S-box-containing protein